MLNSDAETVAARLRLLTPNRGDTPKLARSAGIAPRTLENYRHGRGEPSLSDASRIADVAGVRLEWLATGKGAMRSGEEQPEATAQVFEGGDASDRAIPLIPLILETAIEGTELALDLLKITLTPEQKARVISTLYGINYRRYLIRAAGGTPPDVEQEFSAETMAPDVADLIRLMGAAKTQ